jgi:hypothetical protein
MRRRKMSRSESRRKFSRGANRVHKKNISTVSPYVARGGVRL